MSTRRKSIKFQNFVRIGKEIRFKDGNRGSKISSIHSNTHRYYILYYLPKHELYLKTIGNVLLIELPVCTCRSYA